MVNSFSDEVYSNLRIRISSSFTANPIQKPLEFWARSFGYHPDIEFAPYNQVFQQLLDTKGILNRDSNHLNIILIRPDDWIRYRNEKPGKDQAVHISSVMDELEQALAQYANNLKVPAVVLLTKKAPGCPIDQNALDEFALRLEDLSKDTRMMFIQPEKVDKLYDVTEYHDPDRDKLGHIPYSDDYFTALATAVFRKFQNHIRKTPKVVVLDCDNTLWKGVCGELGPEGIELSGSYQYMQNFMIGQMRSGKILCLCSKNVSEDVQRVFNERPDMILKEDHIVASKVNWQPKSQNIRELSAELNLGLDSFIFVDDNPVECAEVRAACPEVATLCLPEDPSEIPAFLDHTWLFDLNNVTETDQKRTQLYKDNLVRNKFKDTAGSLKEFISGLSLNIHIEEARKEELERVSQLTLRTNQFNFTTVRRSPDDIQDLYRSPDHHILTCRVEDRFGDYGLVGLMICKEESNRLVVDSFMLSCRVLGRGVEFELLAAAGKLALSKGLADTTVCFNKTDKNDPAESFLRQVSKELNVEISQLCRASVQFDSAVLSGITFSAESKSENSDRETAANSEKSLYSEDQAVVRVDLYEHIASELDTAENIRKAISGSDKDNGVQKQNGRIDDDASTVDVIRGIWEDILGADELDKDAHFFDVGGTSLKAVEVLSRINKTFEQEFTIVSLFEHSTINSLAGMVNGDSEGDKELRKIMNRAGNRRNAIRRCRN